MKNRKKLLIVLTKRILFIFGLQVLGVVSAVGLWIFVMLMWFAGFFVLPVALMRSTSDKGEIVLPTWARHWDDTADLEIRGRPAAQFVWQYDLGWHMATFLWLQFYNPLANMRVMYRRKVGLPQ
jgi:hypothetical protein